MKPRDPPGEIAGAYLWGGFALSSNIPLPRLIAISGPGEVRFRWVDQAEPRSRLGPWRHVRGRDGDIRTAVTAGGELVFEMQGAGRFVLRPDEDLIEFAGAGASRNRAEHLLVNTVLAIFAGMKGEVCLHAAGVVTPKGALVLAGPSRSGKSTAALRLIEEGNALLADDALVLRRDGGAWWAYPGSRTIRLEAAPENGSPPGGKSERFADHAGDRAPVGEILLLRTATGEDASASSVLRSLLELQPAWAWGSADCRNRLLAATQRLALEVRVSSREAEGSR